MPKTHVGDHYSLVTGMRSGSRDRTVSPIGKSLAVVRLVVD